LKARQTCGGFSSHEQGKSKCDRTEAWIEARRIAVQQMQNLADFEVKIAHGELILLSRTVDGEIADAEAGKK